MSRLKQALPVLGLSILILCSLTCTAGTAQAETVWRVKGTPVTKELSPLVAIKEVEGKNAALLTKISGVTVEFLCTELQPISVKLQPEGGLAFEAQLKYAGCITKLNGTTSGACEPVNEGKETGIIRLKPLKGAQIEHEKTTIVRFEPTEGETLGTIEMSKECSIATKVPLLGKLTLKDSLIGTEAETHLASPGPLTEMWVISKTEEHKITLDGSMIFKLGGVHAGLLWSGGTLEPEEPKWYVKGVEVTSTLKPLLAMKEIEGSDATLLSKIGGVKVEVLCTGSQLSGVRLEPKGIISSESQVNFSGCTTKLNEKENGACEPNNGGVEPGAIASKSLKGSLVSHENSGIIRLEPLTGETLAVIETGKECSVGEKISLLGKVTLKDGALTTETENHLVTAGPLTELWLVSKTEEHKVTLDGSAVVRLASTHAGLPWKGTVPTTPSSNPGWHVEGKDVTEALTPSLLVKELEGKSATVLTKISGIKVEILCTELQTISAKLQPKGVVGFSSQLKYAGCITKLNGVTSGSCEPVSEGKEPGVIKTKILKGVIVLHEKAGLVLLEATEGESLSTIEFGKECSIVTKVPIIGKLTLQETALETEAVTHLGVVGPLTELWAISKTEEHKITIDGSIIVGLAGTHVGLKWSGKPE